LSKAEAQVQDWYRCQRLAVVHQKLTLPVAEWLLQVPSNGSHEGGPNWNLAVANE
jgi:hypothetical protein